jgi:hypothetical protein
MEEDFIMSRSPESERVYDLIGILISKDDVNAFKTFCGILSRCNYGALAYKLMEKADLSESFQAETNVLVPEVTELITHINKLNAKLLGEMCSLPQAKYKSLHYFWHHILLSRSPDYIPFSSSLGNAAVPSPTESREEMHSEITKHWDCLNPELLCEVVDFLGSDAPELTKLWEKFESDLKVFSLATLAECKKKKVQLSNDPHLKVEYKQNQELFTLQRIMDMKRFLQKVLKMDGALFLGFTSSNVILYFQIASHAASWLLSAIYSDYVIFLQALGIAKVGVSGLWELDIEKGLVIFLGERDQGSSTVDVNSEVSVKQLEEDMQAQKAYNKTLLLCMDTLDKELSRMTVTRDKLISDKAALFLEISSLKETWREERKKLSLKSPVDDNPKRNPLEIFSDTLLSVRPREQHLQKTSEGSSDHHQEQRKGSDVAGKMQERGLLTVEQCQNVRAKARNPKNAKSIASDLAQVIQSWGSTGFTENAAELSSILAEMECSIYQK